MSILVSVSPVFGGRIIKYLPLAATPEFSILRQVTPGAFKGMINADTPDRPSPPVRTAAVQ